MLRVRFGIRGPCLSWLDILGSLEVGPRRWLSTSVIWFMPSGGWFKLNSDGSSRGNPGLSGGGGVVRDTSGNVIFVYSDFFGQLTSFQAEARALCLGLEICNRKGLRNIVAEVDSKVLWLILFAPGHGPPSVRLFVRRIRQLSLLGVTFAHCFWEANMVADSLASFSHSSLSFFLFDSLAILPKLTKGLALLDQLGIANFRFKRG